MTFRFAEAFVGYTAIGDTAESDWSASSVSYNNANGRFGLGGVTVPFNSAFSRGTVPVAVVTDYVIAQFSAKWDAGTRTKESGVIKFGNNGGAQICLSIKRMPNDSVQAWDANGSNVGTSAPGVLTSGQWHAIVVKAQIGRAVGDIKIYVNNMVTPVLDLSSKDLLAGGAATGCDFISWERNPFDDAAAGAQFILSELMIYDTEGVDVWSDLVGDKRLYPLLPTADGQTDFSRIEGASNFEMVNDPLSTTHLDTDSTDYNYSATPNSLDQFAFANLPTGVVGIVGVVSVLTAKKSDGGTEAGDLYHEIISNLFDAALPVGALTNLYRNYQSIFLLDPSTSAAWTAGGVNGMTAGYYLAP
jgi:hypothetical protein